METITSRENAKIKYACRLREEEKLRTTDGLFFAEGPKLCLELARGCTLQTLYATEKALAHTPELEAFAGKTVLVTEPVAQKLSGTKTSQDVFGVFEHPGWQAADILAKGRRILALEAVQDQSVFNGSRLGKNLSANAMQEHFTLPYENEQPIPLTIPKEDGAISEQERHDSGLFDEYGSGLGLMSGGGPSNEAQEAAFDRSCVERRRNEKGEVFNRVIKVDFLMQWRKSAFNQKQFV